MWKSFCPVLPDIRKSVAWFQGSQNSCACPDKNITKIKAKRSVNGLVLKEENGIARTFISIVYSTSVPTLQTTQSVSIIKTNRLMLFRGVLGTFMRIIRSTYICCYGKMQTSFTLLTWRIW